MTVTVVDMGFCKVSLCVYRKDEMDTRFFSNFEEIIRYIQEKIEDKSEQEAVSG